LSTNHLKIDKTVHQLVIETEDIIRQERKKENEDFKKLNAANEEELTNRQNEIQRLQNESQQKQQRIDTLEQKEQQVQLRMDLLEQKEQQSDTEKELLKQLNSSLDQQSKDREENMNSLKREIEVYKILVQSKNNEIDPLRKDKQRDQEMAELKRKMEDYQRYSREPTSFSDNITIKTEPDSPEDSSRACKNGHKKQRV
jgi:chromosome segregation ATPase